MPVTYGNNLDHTDVNGVRHKLEDGDGRRFVCPVEASSTSSAAHPTGSYFEYNNTLYMAIADIAQGSAIMPDTNCEAVPDGISAEVQHNKEVTPYAPYNFSFDDLFENLESSFIDDFTSRESFIDADHPYTLIGTDTIAPTITTGTGAVRSIGETATTSIAYSREIQSWPYYCLIGLVSGVTQLIKLYNDTAFITSGNGCIQINGTNRNVIFNNATYGTLHADTTYVLLYITPDAVTLYDDTGVCVTVPRAYTKGLPKNIAMVFGGAAGRTYGYGSFVEFVKKPMQPLDFDRCILSNRAVNNLNKIKSIISFSRSRWVNNANQMDFYYKPEDNPTMEVVTTSTLSNNSCIKCTVNYNPDNQYRSEIGIRPIDGSLHNKQGGLQRIITSADYYMDSDANASSTYDSYIMQIHDSNFAVEGWVDGPPLALHVSGDLQKLKAYICYIDDGAIPQGDNRHTVDVYDLCDWEMDKWMHIEVEARIGWRTVLAPRLIIRVNGVERLNLQTPIGYNIVSSGGYVTTHYGLYCPQLHYSPTPENPQREILVTNIKFKGTQSINE